MRRTDEKLIGGVVKQRRPISVQAGIVLSFLILIVAPQLADSTYHVPSSQILKVAYETGKGSCSKDQQATLIIVGEWTAEMEKGLRDLGLREGGPSFQLILQYRPSTLETRLFRNWDDFKNGTGNGTPLDRAAPCFCTALFRAALDGKPIVMVADKREPCHPDFNALNCGDPGLKHRKLTVGGPANFIRQVMNVVGFIPQVVNAQPKIEKWDDLYLLDYMRKDLSQSLNCTLPPLTCGVEVNRVEHQCKVTQGDEAPKVVSGNVCLRCAYHEPLGTSRSINCSPTPVCAIDSTLVASNTTSKILKVAYETGSGSCSKDQQATLIILGEWTAEMEKGLRDLGLSDGGPSFPLILHYRPSTLDTLSFQNWDDFKNGTGSGNRMNRTAPCFCTALSRAAQDGKPIVMVADKMEPCHPDFNAINCGNPGLKHRKLTVGGPTNFLRQVMHVVGFVPQVVSFPPKIEKWDDLFLLDYLRKDLSQTLNCTLPPLTCGVEVNRVEHQCELTRGNVPSEVVPGGVCLRCAYHKPLSKSRSIKCSSDPVCEIDGSVTAQNTTQKILKVSYETGNGTCGKDLQATLIIVGEWTAEMEKGLRHLGLGDVGPSFSLVLHYRPSTLDTFSFRNLDNFKNGIGSGNRMNNTAPCFCTALSRASQDGKRIVMVADKREPCHPDFNALACGNAGLKHRNLAVGGPTNFIRQVMNVVGFVPQAVAFPPKIEKLDDLYLLDYLRKDLSQSLNCTLPPLTCGVEVNRLEHRCESMQGKEPFKVVGGNVCLRCAYHKPLRTSPSIKCSPTPVCAIDSTLVAQNTTQEPSKNLKKPGINDTETNRQQQGTTGIPVKEAGISWIWLCSGILAGILLIVSICIIVCVCRFKNSPKGTGKIKRVPSRPIMTKSTSAILLQNSTEMVTDRTQSMTETTQISTSNSHGSGSAIIRRESVRHTILMPRLGRRGKSQSPFSRKRWHTIKSEVTTAEEGTNGSKKSSRSVSTALSADGIVSERSTALETLTTTGSESSTATTTEPESETIPSSSGSRNRK